MSEVTVTVAFPNDASEQISVPAETKIKTIADRFAHRFDLPILGAIADNRLVPLDAKMEKPATIEFLTVHDDHGRQIFLRSLQFILIKAARELFPHAQLHIEYAIGNGLCCFFEGVERIRLEGVSDLERRMREIISQDIRFIHRQVPTEEAVKLFEEAGMSDKVRLLATRAEPLSSIYALDETIDYFYGYLAYSTGAIHDFRLQYHNRGIVLLLPDPHDPTKVEAFKDQPKFFNIITENKKWLDILDLENCGQLNEAGRRGRAKETILVQEALHEKKLAFIADEIHRRREVVRVVSIAGPSSSGKTTTAKRLAIQLRVMGFRPLLISLDNYFVDREKTPIDENGLRDFEGLDAIDVALFNEQVARLLQGKGTNLQRYDFITGKSYRGEAKYRLPRNGIIIVEGIHGLNPKLFTAVPYSRIYKVYVSALANLNLDNHNRIPTTDCRIIRRIVRDAKYRGYDAAETIRRWPLVRRGEERNIFPYQEHADIMFNSSLVYELSVLRTHAEPLIRKVTPDLREHIEARRLLKFLTYFEPIEETFVPFNSILREFIGGSAFDY